MSQRYQPCEREQQYLMPASLRDWLPEDHLAWFVVEAVELLDLSAFHAAYRDDGWGRRAYDPAMMVALLLYAYCEGERSSRRIERRCREDIAYRVLSANQQPDHATICRFRQRHERALAGLFVDVLRLCAEAGLVKAGLVALDGAKLCANASRERNRTVAQLEAEVERMLAEAERVDSEEQRRSDANRAEPLPVTLRGREQRLARLAEAKRHRAAREQERQDAYEARLSERARKDPRGRLPKRPVADPEARVNRTDPDSRVVRDYWGHYQDYNVQAAATREQIAVAAELTRQATDVHELRPMVEAANDNLRALGQAPIGVLLAAAGPAPRGRIPAALSARERMRRKLTTKRGRRLYEQRRWMIEPVPPPTRGQAFGEIKENRGIRRFQRRGFEACASKWKLIAATHNLRKLYRYRRRQSSPGPWGRPPPESRRARCRSERSRPPSVRALARGRRARPSNRRTPRQ